MNLKLRPQRQSTAFAQVPPQANPFIREMVAEFRNSYNLNLCVIDQSHAQQLNAAKQLGASPLLQDVYITVQEMNEIYDKQVSALPPAGAQQDAMASFLRQIYELKALQLKVK